MMTNDIIGIHGAFSTPTIFNFLKKELSDFDWTFIDYSAITSNVNKLISNITDEFKHSKKQYHIVSHSMGGLIALSLCPQPWIKSITTIATPLNGLDISLLHQYLSRSSFLSEIGHYSKFLGDIHKKSYNIPIQHIITTDGFNPFCYEKSDGVVTLRSQRGWKCGQTIDIQSNHTEVMLDEKVINILKDFWIKAT